MKIKKLIILVTALIIMVSGLSGCMNLSMYENGKSSVREGMASASGWGVDLKINGGLYSTPYSEEQAVFQADHNVNRKNGIRVKFEDKAPHNEYNNYLAPGTKNDEGLNLSFTGEPEADYQLEVNIETENIFLAQGTYGIMIPIDGSILNIDNFYDISDCETLYTEKDGAFEETDEFLSNTTYYTLEDKVENNSIYYPVTYNLSSIVTDDLTTSFVIGDESSYKVDTLNEISKLIFKKITGEEASESSYTIKDGKIMWNSFESKIYKAKTSLSSNVGLSDVNLNWNYNASYDVNEQQIYDDLDTMLGNLVFNAQENNDASKVVKLQNDGTYKEPIETVDYNLESLFMIDVLVKRA